MYQVFDWFAAAGVPLVERLQVLKHLLAWQILHLCKVLCEDLHIGRKLTATKERQLIECQVSKSREKT